MITKLRGTIDEVHEAALDLDVNGVIYHVLCSKRTLQELETQTGSLKLYTELVVREDSMTLYGFSCAYERDCFRTLTSVQGVGNKVGLAILSIAAPGKIFDAISAQDKAFISQAEGVGPKLAARLINELKDKVRPRLNLHKENEPLSKATHTRESTPEIQLLQDSISALTNLGFKPIDADKAVRSILETTPDLKVNEVIRMALSKLSGTFS